MPTTSAQRHTRHASSTRDATYTFFMEIDLLAGFKVEESACACNSDALVQPVALLETLRDLPLHSLAHASVVVLLPARQKQQSQQQHSSTHHANLRHAAVALQALSNQTTTHISQRVVVLHHTPSHAPQAPSIKVTLPSTLSSKHAPHPTHPPSHAPAYQVDLLQALESAEACAQRLNVVILQLLQRVA